MTARLYLRRLDWTLILAVAGVLAFSFVTVRSVTGPITERNHLTYILVGVVAAIAVSLVDPKVYRRLLWPGYAALLLLLVVVLGLAGARGSSRWIHLPGFDLQPSEMGKIVVIVILSAFVADRARDHPGAWRTFFLVLGLVSLPAGLVFLEPDLGTAIVYGVAAIAILFIAGARLVQIALVLAALVLSVALVFSILPAAGIQVLQPYQTARLTAFLDPSGSSQAAYQSEQSKNAIGSGGVAGRGVEGATVSNAGFLPEQHTDFVFAVVGEQRGFIGTGLLVFLLGVVVWRAVRTITLAATVYESLIAAGVVGMFLTQVFVNVGMTLGIMPTTGIPLPFMTYGGSNTITNLVAIGLLLAIQVRGAVPEPPPFADRATTVRALPTGD
jgi:rod shape determining protein RodA